jgi:hypothetical protein
LTNDETLAVDMLLIEFRILGTSRPEKGDSGSPVITRLPDGTAILVGMHIGQWPRSQ